MCTYIGDDGIMGNFGISARYTDNRCIVYHIILLYLSHIKIRSIDLHCTWPIQYVVLSFIKSVKSRTLVHISIVKTARRASHDDDVCVCVCIDVRHFNNNCVGYIHTRSTFCFPGEFQPRKLYVCAYTHS